MAVLEVMTEMISVIIPTYNSASYISESISSIRRQGQGGEAEIIVVDDGSSDNTGDIVRRLMKDDAGIRYIPQEHLFAASARNRGISEARDEWIYLLDADDVSSEDCLATLLDAAHKKGASAVFGLTEDFISPELTEMQKAGIHPRPEAYPGVLPGASLIRKAVFDTVGLFDTTLSTGETVDWTVRFRESGFSSECVPFVALHRRLHLSNTGRLRKSVEAADYARIIRRRMSEKR